MQVGPETIVSRRGRPYVEETERGLVVEPGPGRYVRLNGPAATLWRALGRPISVRALAGRLVEAFGIGEEHALADTTAFVRALRARDLLDTTARADGRGIPRADARA